MQVKLRVVGTSMAGIMMNYICGFRSVGYRQRAVGKKWRVAGGLLLTAGFKPRI